MIKINLESDWKRERVWDYFPDKHSYNTTIRIPEKGKLPRLGHHVLENILKDELDGYRFKVYEEIMELKSLNKPRRDYIKGYPSVILRKRDRFVREENDVGLLMLWIKERKEWIVIWHYTWVEIDSAFADAPVKEYSEYERFDGPFALDEVCANKILEAYGVPIGKILLEKLRKTSPLELEAIALLEGEVKKND